MPRSSLTALEPELNRQMNADASFVVASPLSASTAIRMASPTPASPFTCAAPVGVISVAARTPLAWSSDGNSLAAVGGNGSLFVLQFAADTFRMTKLLVGHKHAVRTLLFHPKDNNILVSGGMEGLFVWDISTQAVTQIFSHKSAKELGSLAAVATSAGAHESDVECMCWAFDGTSLVTGGKDTNIKIWDTSRKGQWRLLETITGHKAAVLTVKFHAESQRLATAGRDSSIKLWDASTLDMGWRARRADDSGITCVLQGTCEAHGDIVALTWSADGKQLISGSRDNSLKLWDVATCMEVRDIFDKKLGKNGKHRSDICRAVFLPNMPGHVMTCSMDGTVRVWRLQQDATATGVATNTADSSLASGTFASPTVGVDAAGTGIVADLPAGLLETSDLGSSGWDDSTKALLNEILGNSTASVVSTARLAGVDSCISSLSFFENEAGVVDMQLNPTKPVVAIASSDNAFALLALRLDTLPWLERQYDGTLPPGSLPPGTNLNPLITVQAFYGHTATVNSVVLMPDDKTVFTASSDYTTAKFDISTVERSGSYVTQSSVYCITLAQPPSCPMPVVFAGCSDYAIRAYSSNPSDYEPLFAAHASLAVPQRPAGHEYELARYVGHSGCVVAVTVDSKSRLMASGGRDWSILLWDLTRPSLTVAKSPRDESDVPIVAPIASIDGHKGHITAMQFSADACGNLLATAANDHTVKVWRITSGLTGTGLANVWSSSDHTSAVSALSWGSGPLEAQQLLFTGSWDTTLKVWSGVTPHRGSGQPTAPSDAGVVPLKTLVGHTARVTGVAVAPAGDVFVSASADLTARVWKIKDGFACLAIFYASPSDGIFSSLSVGSHVFVTGSDTGLQVWPLRPNGPFSKRFALPAAGTGPDSFTSNPVLGSPAAPHPPTVRPLARSPAPADDSDSSAASNTAPLLRQA